MDGSWKSVISDDVTIYFKGYAYGSENIFSIIKQRALKSTSEDCHPLSRIKFDKAGHYSFLVRTSEFVFVAVDDVRSFPIFVIEKNGKFTFSSSVLDLKNDSFSDSYDEYVALEILASGYSLGDGAIFRDVKIVNAGQYAICSPKKGLTIVKDNIFKPWSHKEPGEESVHELAALTEKIFFELIEELDGRQVVVPLSAGNDSRLVVAMLKHFGYENVLCFTYGIRASFEAEAARQIAAKLGYKWRFIELFINEERAFYESFEFEQYNKYAETFDAVPYFQGLSSVRRLRAGGEIDDDSVWINGNSGDFISGGHVDPDLVDAPFDVELGFQKFLSKHLSLWQDLKTPLAINNLKSRYKSLKQNLEQTEEFIPVWAFNEWLEYKARQSKYVVAGQRTYEFYGYEWRLPLWDHRYLAYWSTVHPTAKVNQSLFKKMLSNKNYCGLWSEALPVNRKNVRPVWLLILRIIFKGAFAPFFKKGRKLWKTFDRIVFSYFYDVTRMMCIVSYGDVLKSFSRGARNHASFAAQIYVRKKQPRVPR